MKIVFFDKRKETLYAIRNADFFQVAKVGGKKVWEISVNDWSKTEVLPYTHYDLFYVDRRDDA